MITKDQYLYFVDIALDEMCVILTDLGDDLANRRPDLPGANSAYAICTHCLGVMVYWGSHTVAGRQVERDRAAEFTATGSVKDLIAHLRHVRNQFAEDVASAELESPLRVSVSARWIQDVPGSERQGVVLMHVYRELAQHLGHMELGRDLLRAQTG